MPEMDDQKRYWGKYRGTVLDPSDVGMKGRITALVTMGGIPLTVVAEACTPYAGPLSGFFAIPPVGAGVWIEFVEGDLNQPVYTGCWWREGEVGLMFAPELPSPSTVVLRTPFARLKMDTLTGEATLECLFPPANPALPTKVSVSATGVEATFGLNSVKITTTGVEVKGFPVIKLN